MERAMEAVAPGVVAEADQHEGRRQRRAIVAAVIGNVLEWYDFAVYGYFVPVISQLFFPNSTPVVAVLLTFAVFGVGFVARPAGSVLFGVYGDRYGRKRALGAVVMLMAVATLALGLLPTYASVGVLAPVLLVVARLAQGLSGGGEWGGSAAYLVEFAPEGRRGFIGSWQQVSVGGGFLLGSAVATALNAGLTHEQLVGWGWRAPFLAGVLLAGVGAYIRFQLDDTPKFSQIEAAHQVAQSPLREAFTTNLRETAVAFGITLHNTVAYYIVLIYMPTYLTRVAKLSQGAALGISTSCLLVFVVLVPFMGRLSDRVGRRGLLIASALGYAVLAYPAFLLASSGNVPLALLAQFVLVVLLAVYAGPAPAVYSELFPTRVRYTALSVGYNVPVAIFGGFAPFIATWLIDALGTPTAPALYVIVAAVATLVTMIWVPETAFKPLR